MNNIKRTTIFVVVLLFAAPFWAIAQQAQQPENVAQAEAPSQPFRPEELDQMLAPIALYPDALLAQILTAATYPLDVVAADRFVKEHAGLKGNALMDAAKDQVWSPSVKAMLQFPDVLAMMDNQLEWTTKLGNAFLAQQRDCMDSVQRLREKAYAQGQLVTNKQEVVKVEPQTNYIVIEQANPQIVYVPVYDPAIVYGVWWYPGYPPYYCYYPGFAFGFFLPPFFVDVIWGWGVWDCDWFHRDIIIDVSHFNRFARRHFDRPGRFEIRNARGHVAWRHDPEFRRTLGYPDYRTAQRFGGRQVSNVAVTSGASVRQGREQRMPTNKLAQISGRENMGGAQVSAPAAERENIRPSMRGKESIRPAELTPQRTEVRGIPETRVAPQPTTNFPRESAVKQPVVTSSGGEVSRERERLNFWSGADRGAAEREASFRGESSTHSFKSSSPAAAGSAVSHGGGGGGWSGGRGGESGGRGGGRR